MIQKLPTGIRRKIANYFLKPKEFVESIDISPGNRVLEIGVPVGFFAKDLLDKVGSDGEVYVAGPNRDSLSRLATISKHRNLKLGLLSDLLTGDAIHGKRIDKVILTNLLSNTLQPDKFCLSLEQYLKNDSEVILIDWDGRFENVGPMSDRKVTREDALKLMKKCGMKFKRLLNLSGYHYGIVFEFDSSK